MQCALKQNASNRRDQNMQIVVLLFHCHFLSNVYFLSSFVKCVITIFGFTMCYYYVGFGNREIYSVGQLVHPKDGENCVQIRLYLFYFSYGDFLRVWMCLATSCTYDCIFLKFFMDTNFLLIYYTRLWTKSFDSCDTNPDLSTSSLTSGVRYLTGHRPWLHCCYDNLPHQKIHPFFW